MNTNIVLEGKLKPELERKKMSERVTLSMTIKEVLIVMGGGNPGALTVCMDILKRGVEIDPQNAMGGLSAILSMDTLGIYEHRIWMLYKNVCGESLEKMLGLLRANQLGYISPEILNRGIDNCGEGIDVEGLFDKVREQLPQFAVDKILRVID